MLQSELTRYMTLLTFARHHDAVWVLVLGVAVFNLAQQMTVWGFSAKRPSKYIVPKLARSVIFVTLGLWLSWHGGIMGVAIAVAISALAYLTLVSHANRRIGHGLALASNHAGATPAGGAAVEPRPDVGGAAAASFRPGVSKRDLGGRSGLRSALSDSVTIVTPVFNMAAHIEPTIQSVLGNLLPGDEYFIVDGNSTDGTVDIIRRHEPQLTGWISEPDSGYADALFKGFSRGGGGIYCWINAGDLLLPGALDAARRALQDTGADMIFGDDFYIDERGRVISFSRGYVPDLRAAMLYGGWTPLQDACFWRRSLYEGVGGIDRSLRYAADYDLFLRMALAGRTAYVPMAFSAFRRHAGQKSIAGSQQYGRERTRVRRRELARSGFSFERYARSVAQALAVRWRVHVSQKRWVRPDLEGRPIAELRCGSYWPASRPS